MTNEPGKSQGRILLARRGGYSIIWSEHDDADGMDALDDFASRLRIPNTRCSLDEAGCPHDLYHYKLRVGAETERALANGAVESDLDKWVQGEQA